MGGDTSQDYARLGVKRTRTEKHTPTHLPHHDHHQRSEYSRDNSGYSQASKRFLYHRRSLAQEGGVRERSPGMDESRYKQSHPDWDVDRMPNG